ncbi:MAG TPA: surface carbohydrate biosynthesis protein, partial [Myxococcota bacterium]
DAKLLLACAAAERGFTSILGYRTQIDFRIAGLPRSIYVSKSMTPKSAKMFRILRRLGHEVAVGDEEALVYFSPEIYHARRMSPQTLPLVSMLLAWGNDNVELWRKHPEYRDTPIHVVGNPRVDLLRPELADFFAEDVRGIRERFGKFVLVNTNFGMVNAFLDTFNVFKKSATPGGEGEPGTAARGASLEFARGYAAHKTALFRAFQAMLPDLAAAHPGFQFVVRPHPVERREPWLDAARDLPNVHVVHEGNVVSWLRAASGLIHNGCTTAVEAAVVGTPVITYRPIRSAVYDLELPNGVGHEAAGPEALCDLAGRVLRGELGPAAGTGARRLGEHLDARDGALAADRIVEVLAQSEAVRRGLPRPALHDQLRGWFDATQRSFVKQVIKARIPGHRNNPAFQRHRFEGVRVDELRARVGRLGRALGRFETVQVEPVAEHIFRVGV